MDHFSSSPDFHPDNLVTIDAGSFTMVTSRRLSVIYDPKSFEKYTAALIRSSLHEGDLFADIGAHHGFYTLLASGCVGPAGTVLSVEPVSGNQAILKRNIDLNHAGNVTVILAAVSDQTGESDFHVAGASDASGFYEHPHSPTSETIVVRTLTLDEICGEKPIHVVKIDVEGHEPLVMKGMQNILRLNPDIRIFVEFNPDCLTSAGSSPERFLEELDGYGLDICFIDDQANRLYRYDPACRDGYRKILKGRSTLNLLCTQKSRYPLVQIFSHSSLMTGGERTLLNMVDAMLLKGFLVHVTLPDHGPLERELQHRSVSCDFMHVPPWIHGIGFQPGEYIAHLSQIMPSLVIRSLEINAHLIISNTSVIVHGALAALIMGKPHFWRISEFGRPEYGLDFLFDAETRKEFVAWSSDKILFSSNLLMQDYFDYITDNQSVIMAPGIFMAVPPEPKPATFSPDKTWSVIYPAMIMPGKRQEDIVRSLVVLKEKGFSNFTVTFFGNVVDTTYYQHLIELINSAELGSAIAFMPFTEEITSEYDNADIVVSCSLMESFGRIIVEGMAYGKIVVGAASGGTLGLITHGETGLLFEPGNASDLAENLIYATTHPVEMHRMAGHAREFSRQFCGSGHFASLPGLVSVCVGTDRIVREIKQKRGLGSKFFQTFLLDFYPGVIRLMEEQTKWHDTNIELARLREQNTKLQKEMQQVMTSRSWKLTAPLRWLFRLFGWAN
jgi:FkbM family methyltransferase